MIFNSENTKINGNTATVTVEGMNNVVGLIWELSLVDQFSVILNSKEICVWMYDVSFPMNKGHHVVFASLIHRYNAEKKAKTHPPKGPNNDGNGPKPTNPRGSGGSTVEFQNTVAIAA